MSADYSDVYVAAKDIIGLTDLMFRWKYDPAYNILRAMRSWSLRLFYVLDDAKAIHNQNKFRLTRYPLGGEQLSYCASHFDEIFFLVDEVKMIEADNGFQFFMKRRGDEDKLNICTAENLCRLAPQLLYVLLCYSREKDVSRSLVREMLHADDVDYKYAVFNLANPSLPRSDWRIGHDKLWSKHSLPKLDEKSSQPINNNTYRAIKNFIADKREKGLVDAKILLGLISEYVPFLNNRQLGAMLPAKPGVPIQSASREKRGYRLRKSLDTNTTITH